MTYRLHQQFCNGLLYAPLRTFYIDMYENTWTYIPVHVPANARFTGFAVRMMVKATVPVNEQRAFVEKKREDILLWIIDEIMRTPVLLKKIGDLEYFKPTEVILLQNNEMEVLAPAGLIRACRGVLHLQCFCPGLNLSHLFFVLILIA